VNSGTSMRETGRVVVNSGTSSCPAGAGRRHFHDLIARLDHPSFDSVILIRLIA
jgi:hypothetical protein